MAVLTITAVPCPIIATIIVFRIRVVAMVQELCPKSCKDMTPSQSNVIVTSTPICNHYDRTWSWGHCSETIGMSQDCVRPFMCCTTHVGYIFHVIPLALLV